MHSRTTPDVLVTGASGFIGGQLTRRLVQRGHRVRVLVREHSDRAAIADLPVDVAIGCLTDLESLVRAAVGVRHAYHCAGKSADWGSWQEFAQANVAGSQNLVYAAQQARTVERLLHVSTTDVYGYPVQPCDEAAEPRDIGLPYNRSKVLSERVITSTARRIGLPYTIVRPATVYGPGSKDFAVQIAKLLLQRQMIYIGRGRTSAGLLYVTNAVDAMIAACTSSATVGKAYNLRDPGEVTWQEYVTALADGLGVKPPSLSVPGWAAARLAHVSEVASGALRRKSRPLLTRHAVHLFGRDQSYPIGRAVRDFGFTSDVGFAEGISSTIEWLDSPEGRRRVGN